MTVKYINPELKLMPDDSVIFNFMGPDGDLKLNLEKEMLWEDVCALSAQKAPVGPSIFEDGDVMDKFTQ
eukprot:2624334-Rhodomonas_salina.1